MEWQAYLEKAQSNLRVAEMAYNAGEYDSAASRAYYAVFHAEIAALLELTDFRPARWGHERVQQSLTVGSSKPRKSFRRHYEVFIMTCLDTD